MACRRSGVQVPLTPPNSNVAQLASRVRRGEKQSASAARRHMQKVRVQVPLTPPKTSTNYITPAICEGTSAKFERSRVPSSPPHFALIHFIHESYAASGHPRGVAVTESLLKRKTQVVPTPGTHSLFIKISNALRTPFQHKYPLRYLLI